MKQALIISVLTFLQLATCFVNASSLSEKDLWKHVVNIDRMVWSTREGQKKINKHVDDESFVRRIYLDITGKIPTYDQMLEFRQSKNVNKYSVLIKELLNSPGYVSHYTVFWQDLLRNENSDSDRFYHREFTRYIEKFLSENKPYDKIVYDLIMAEGTVSENPAIAFYNRDKDTGTVDTFNATTRAFLGTRLGCAQCHNHRFDKWTQKEFYESSAYLHGVQYGLEQGPVQQRHLGRHMNAMKSDKRFSGKITNYSKVVLMPSLAKVTFNEKTPYTYPDNYVYDNAKPGSLVKERIVFDYGDKELKGENRREKFANWLASKNNPTFARVMTNRLWKRIMGVANMDPVDDYKDSVIIQNSELYNELGDIFISLNYDFKAFFTVLFNTEAYQYSYDSKNEIKQDDYKVQGALLKRMSSNQLSDSLAVLQHGNVDKYIKVDPQYFEFEEKLYKVSTEYKKEAIPLIKAFVKQYGPTAEEIDPEIVDVQFKYLEKIRELEDYYDIAENGYIKNRTNKTVALASQKSKKVDTKKPSMMMEEGSMKYGDGKNSKVQLAHYSNSDFLKVFGRSDRSSPQTDLNTTATMKQLLKLANSPLCINVTKPDSYLMKNAMSKEKVGERVSYLYYSIYGRAPDKAEVKLAINYCKKIEDVKRWSKYVLALLNSPEFYFIK